MYDDGDILLFALSFWRNTSWAAFKKCFDTVNRKHRAIEEKHENATIYRWRVLRILRSLGHIDLRLESGAIQEVVVAPPVLVALPGFGIRKAVLCGARSPDTVQELRKAVALTDAAIFVQSQSMINPFTPTRVEVQAESDAHIRAAAESCRICYSEVPPARWIAEMSASLHEYCLEITWSKEEDLNWHREDFDIDNLRFGRPITISPQLRLSRYQNPVTSIWRYRLWRYGQFANVDLDWGRYAILAMLSRKVLRYDQASRKVFVPAGTPLPVLLSRAFGLCSGFASELKTLPSCTTTGHLGRCEVFRDVPPSIFKAVASKLEGPRSESQGHSWTFLPPTKS